MQESREEFVKQALEKEESISKLCRMHGISRKTGYKWLTRYQGGEGLDNRNCRPFHMPNKTPRETELLILELRAKHPAWGPRKLKRRLEDMGYENLPAASTIAAILKRNGCISEKESQQRRPYRRFERDAPNELWQMDFKGYIHTVSQTICHPLTLLDDHSWFSLCLEAKENQKAVGVKASLQRLFRTFGMPEAILCDNGAPWGDNHLSLSSLDIWFMQLDILPIHIQPRYPQTQGKEELFHLTLTKEVPCQPLDNLSHAQQVFDRWRHIYNNERPHGALNLDVPARHYHPSQRQMPDPLNEPEYPPDSKVGRVNANGILLLNGTEYPISKSLARRYVKIVDNEQGMVKLHYANFKVAQLDPMDKVVDSIHIFRVKSKNL